MQCISIQIQPEFSRNFDKDAFLTRVRAIRSPAVDAIEERGKLYINFNFFTERPAQLWQELYLALYVDSNYRNVLAPISVAFYDDETGEESLLLHHFDPREKLDKFA